MADDLFYWKENHFIEIAEIRHRWGFISLKKPKWGTAGIHFIEKSK